MSILVTKPIEPFGIEIREVDLASIELNSIRNELLTLLDSHQLVVFRNQSISPKLQIELSETLGELEPSIAQRPLSHQVPGHLGVLRLSNDTLSETSNYGFGWHSDGLAYARVPQELTILYCLTCPIDQGSTLFSSQYLAYQKLPETIKSRVEDLYWELPKIAFSEVPLGQKFYHPIIRKHEYTNKKFIYFSPQAKRILSTSDEENNELLMILHRAQTDKSCIYQHYWKPNDLAIWQNCALLHTRQDIVPVNLGRRVMHRTATKGKWTVSELEKPQIKRALQ